MNKTKISILLLVVAFCTGLSAQAKFGFGPKLGMNVNQMSFSGSKLLDSDNRCGFTGGLTAEYIAPVLGIGVDISLMYSHMKTTVAVGEGAFSATESVSGNFFEIPLHLKYKLSVPAIQSIIAPYIYTGPSVAFKLSGENSYFGTKETQWGWDLGIGLELIKHLQIGAGYTWGMNKLAEVTVADYAGVGVSKDIKVKNNYWTITAAWMF
jgi:hypothetical protein